MTKIEAVTTFHEAGLRKYGLRMLSTYDKHWSGGIPLTVYYEDWHPSQYGIPDYPLVRYRDLALSDWLGDFKIRHADKRPVSGYRMDVVRFSHKVAALLHALSCTDAHFVIWLDGDIVTHEDFHIEDLEPMLPTDTWIAWLNRDRNYPECGFYIINTQHPAHGRAIEQLRAMYDGDKFLHEKEWHDSYLLQQVVLWNGIVPRSLSGRGARTHHPLVAGPLGHWFDHLKGKRKDNGRSYTFDLVGVQRKERYWR